MRNVCLKAVVLTLTLVGLAGSALRTEAQVIQNLIQFTSSWQYDQTGRQLPTNWMTSAYTPDAQWGALSPGLLGSEPDTPAVYTAHAPIQTPLIISGAITTYYFRTTFNYTGPLANVTLISTNLVDDGCAIYLNGLRVGGVRIPAGYNALNSALFFGGGTEGALEVVTFTNVSALRTGANLLAVEVHQSANPSSDVMFGMRLLSIVPTQLVITTNLQDVTAVAGDTAAFSVGVSGGPVTYRWFRGATPLSSTSNTLSIPNVQLANAATNYYVVVSNIVNTVTSRVATLTVVADTDGPELVQAILNNTPQGGTPYPTNTINVFFDEQLNGTPGTNATSALNTNNYVLVSSTNSNIRIPFRLAQYSVSLHLLLTIDASNTNWNPAGSYYLLVNNVADVRGNNIAPNSVIGVSILVTTNLTQMGDVWNFYDFNLFDPGGLDIYTNTSNPWYGTNYNTVTNYGWGSGVGIFDTQNPGRPNVTCDNDTVRSVVSYNVSAEGIDVPTLFRRSFNVPAGLPANGTLRLRYAIDDGLVVYVNGVEIHRYNMPPGPLSHLSQASTQIGTTVPCTANVSAQVLNLKPGVNVVAAAVYQAAAINENDTTFGLEMDLVSVQTRQAPTNRLPAPRVAYTRVLTNGGRHFVLSWPATNYGYDLQYSTNIPAVGPLATQASRWWTDPANWTQVADQSNPYTNRVPPTTGPRRFYRLWRERLN